MNPQDPLAALHPLRTPEPVGWWPLAPGWWAAGLAVILLLAFAACLARRRHRRHAYRRQALQELERLQQSYGEHGDASRYLAQVNALLKSVALLAYPRSEVAAIHGGQWRDFLNRSLPQELQLQPAFDDAVYRKRSQEIDPAQVHRAAQAWIRKHRAAP